MIQKLLRGTETDIERGRDNRAQESLEDWVMLTIKISLIG